MLHLCHADSTDLAVRYALLVSLRTAEESVDLDTPIATELAVPVTQRTPIEVPIEIPGEM